MFFLHKFVLVVGTASVLLLKHHYGFVSMASGLT